MLYSIRFEKRSYRLSCVCITILKYKFMDCTPKFICCLTFYCMQRRTSYNIILLQTSEENVHAYETNPTTRYFLNVPKFSVTYQKDLYMEIGLK